MTGLTYKTRRESNTDRDYQHALLQALQGSELALRLDDCGAWRINGKRGHIYTWGEAGGWLIYCCEKSARRWSTNKPRLSFCVITQDGDTGGCLYLEKLPTPQQSIAIRAVLGIRRRRSPLSQAFHPRSEGVSPTSERISPVRIPSHQSEQLTDSSKPNYRLSKWECTTINPETKTCATVGNIARPLRAQCLNIGCRSLDGNRPS